MKAGAAPGLSKAWGPAWPWLAGVAFALAAGLLCARWAQGMGLGMVWDDKFYIKAWMQGHAWRALLPFAFDGNSYWRPWSTGTMALPMAWVDVPSALPAFQWLGKAMSSAAVFGAAWIAVEPAIRARSAGRHGWLGLCASAAMAALLAMHPLFAEASFWWSDMCDAWLCLWAVALWRACSRLDPSPLACAALGALACLSKEPGLGWCAGAAMALWLRGPGSPRSAAKALLGAAILCLAARLAALAWLPASFHVGEIGPSRAWQPMAALGSLGRSVLYGVSPGFDPAPLHFASGWPLADPVLGAMAWAACAALAASAWLRRARGLSWMPCFFAALALALAGAQSAAAALWVPAGSHPLRWLRFAAPSAMVLGALAFDAAASLPGRRGLAALAACAAFLAAAALGDPGARSGFASEWSLWGSAYARSGLPDAGFKFCAQSKARGLAGIGAIRAAWEDPASGRPPVDWGRLAKDCGSVESAR